MSKRSFIPFDCIAALNTIKQGLQMKETPFSKETILTGLKNCNLPTNQVFWKVFRNSGLLQEVSKGKFMFTSKNPIHVSFLSDIKTEYQKLLHKRNQKKEVQENKDAQTVELPKEESQITSAINLLKKNGYKILVPIATVYKEI